MGVGLYGPWFSAWLSLLKNEWARIARVAGSVEPDALLFHSGDDELYVPMTYGEGLATLRHLLAQWGLLSPEQVQNQNFTLHSCKTTLLSWANQLSLSEDLRAVQGHHRNSSARLYSGDDVFGALALQSAVLKALQGGWRPLCPQHRGGQVPLQEPPLQERSGHFAEASFAIPCGAPVVEVAARSEEPPLQAPDSSGSAVGTQMVSTTLPVPEPRAELPLHSTGDLEDPEEVLFIVTARTIHKAVECAELERCSTFQGIHLKPACGCIVSTFQVVHFAPAGKNYCRHKRAWSFNGQGLKTNMRVLCLSACRFAS